MTIHIPDQLAARLGPTERDALVTLACWLYDSGRLDMGQAGELAGLDRVRFESALKARGIALFHPSLDDVQSDLSALKRKSA